MANSKYTLSETAINSGLEPNTVQSSPDLIPHHIRCLSSVPVDLESLLLEIEREEEAFNNEVAQ